MKNACAITISAGLPRSFSEQLILTDDLHARISARGAELEAAIGRLELEPGRHFAAVRRDIRGFIAESEAGRDVEARVEELLS
jgi:hypothetical protein